MKSKFYHTLHIEKTKRSDDKMKRENQWNNYDAAELEVLEKVNMLHRANHLPQQLSGGQQQRVSIGRALINHPAILLADEPTGNLDSRSSDEIVELLKLSNQKYNQTIVMITHNLEIAKIADRILRIEDGRLV